jgi:anti-sigma-K factor RskA
MIDENLQTEAALYALGALPDQEAAAFRSLLATNPELAALVAEYEAVATEVVADSLPALQPPARLRENILSSIAAPRTFSESPRIAWLPWALAAGFAFAAGVLWMQNDHLRLENRSHLVEWTKLNGDLQAANTDRAQKLETLAYVEKQLAETLSVGAAKSREIAGLQATVKVLESRNAVAEMEVATLTSKLDASYLASIAWDKNSQEGVLKIRRLPEAERGKDYQLWVVDPKYAVRPDGSATIHFAPEQKITDASAFAVTLERAGGVPKAEGPVVLSN